MKELILATLIVLSASLAIAGEKYYFDDEPRHTQEYEVRSRIGPETIYKNRNTGERIKIYDYQSYYEQEQRDFDQRQREWDEKRARDDAQYEAEKKARFRELGIDR